MELNLKKVNITKHFKLIFWKKWDWPLSWKHTFYNVSSNRISTRQTLWQNPWIHLHTLSWVSCARNSLKIRYWHKCVSSYGTGSSTLGNATQPLLITANQLMTGKTVHGIHLCIQSVQHHPCCKILF